MKKLSITELAAIIKASHEPPATSHGFFTGVSTDSKTIKPGNCFFAITGPNFDGHNFLADVFSKGASCAVVSQDIPADKFPGKAILKVSDTITALGRLANFYRTDLNTTVISITGSVGKTTTRQIIYNCLSRHFPTVQSPKSFNNNIGLPLTLLTAESNTRFVIAELGTNHPGEISSLSKIAAPDIALITNVYPAHLEGFCSIESIAEEKSSIADGLKKDGCLFVNADQPLLLDACRKKNVTLETFGLSDSADIQAKNISLLPLASRFTINDTAIDLPLPGHGNILNALAAWAVCKKCNIKIAEFAADLKSISPVTMRTELLQIGSSAIGSAVGETPRLEGREACGSPKGGLTILNDCYNANPASMANALQILANIDPAGSRRLVFICGDMNELGKDSEKFHAQLGRLIAQTKIQLLITAGPLSKITAREARNAANQKIETFSFNDAASICNNLQKLIQETDIILVKASRAIGLETVVEKLKQIFSSKTIHKK